MTKVMFSSLRDEVDPTIAAISTMLVFVTTGARRCWRISSAGGAGKLTLTSERDAQP